MNSPCRGKGGRRQGNCVEINGDCHETKIRKASGTIIVNENVRLLSRLARYKKNVVNDRWYPFEIPVNNPQVVEVGCARHDLRELEAIENKVGIQEDIVSGLTNCKRFTSGLDLVYPITFPFFIQ